MVSDGRRRAIARFRRSFGGEPEFLVRSPGRVNLIGDHTDYNDGFVLPMAIDRSVWLAGRATADRHVHVVSPGFGSVRVDLDHIEPADSGWGEYVTGMAWSLACSGAELHGWQGVVESDVPVGAGLSSSAALELAVARALSVSSALPWDPVENALAAQRAENEWVGMACGIMDQLVVASATEDAALLIDCRSLATRPVPIPPAAAVLVVDSGTRRSLVTSAYNQRRTECEEAAARLGKSSLREVDEADLTQAVLPQPLARRARHVVTENRRVLAFDAALRDGDLAAAGDLLVASHRSLRNDFEVSIPQIDALAAALMGIRGVYGARMTGAGFGGCLVSLVDADRIEDVADDLQDQGQSDITLYATRPAAGTSVESM